MDRFACGSCGAKMVVQRRGGTVALVQDASYKLKIGTDDNAAQLALARLAEEQQKFTKPGDARADEKFNRTKWGFGIGGALLLAGIVASSTVKKLKRRPLRRAELPPRLASRVENLRSVLADVYPMTREQWLDSLRRDLNPEKEVLWWERVAGCFKAFVAKRSFSADQKQAVFKIIFGLSSGMREQDLASDLAKLPESEMTDLARTVRSLPH